VREQSVQLSLAALADRIAVAHGLRLPTESFEGLVFIFASDCGALGSQCLGRMIREGHRPQEAFCRQVLRRCLASQSVELAEAMAAELRSTANLRMSDLKRMMKLYIRSDLPCKVCDLYPDILQAGEEPDPVTYAHLLRCVVAAGRADMHKELLERSDDTGCIKASLMKVRSASQAGDLPRALRLFRLIQQKHADLVDSMAYNIAIDACCDNLDMDAATQLFEEMDERGVERTVVTYNTMVKGYCSLGDLDSAKRVLEVMQAHGRAPNGTTFSSLMAGATKQLNFDEASDILSMMDYFGMPINAFVVSILIQASRRTDDAERAAVGLAVLDRPEVNVFEDAVVFDTVLDCCIHWRDQGRLEKFASAFDADKLGWRPSARTYGLLIKACTILGATERAGHLWQDMMRRGISPGVITLTCMIDALVEGRQVDEASSLFEHWKSKLRCDTITYATLLKGFASVGDSTRALALQKEMLAHGVQMNVVAYTALISACASAGETEVAARVLDDMSRVGCRPSAQTYSALIRGHCLKGEMAEALSAFRKAVAGGLRRDSVIYNTLLSGCLQHRQWRVADMLLEEMQQQAVERTSVTNSVVVRMWSQRGDLEKAIAAVYGALETQGVPSQGGRRPRAAPVDAYVGCCLVGACMHHREPKRALEIFRDMRTWPHFDGPDLRTYNAMICGLARHRFLHEAVKLVEELCATQHTARIVKAIGHGTFQQLFRALRERGDRAAKLSEGLVRTLADAGIAMQHSWLAD